MERAALDAIKSRDNSLIKLARALHDRKEREAQGLALLEGVRLVDDALMQHVPISGVIYTETLLSRPGGRELVNDLSHRTSRVAMATKDVFDSISTTETSQGVVAIARIQWSTLNDVVKRMSAGPLIILDSVQDPGNVGTIIRVAAASGASGVVVGPGTADPFSPKCLRASAGSAFRVPVCRPDDWAPALQHIARSGLMLVADIAKDAKAPWEWDLSGRVALVLANEGAGPSAGVLDAAAGVIKIPMPGGVESLNVAMSASILLYEAVRQRALIGD